MTLADNPTLFVTREKMTREDAHAGVTAEQHQAIAGIINLTGAEVIRVEAVDLTSTPSAVVRVALTEAQRKAIADLNAF